VTSDNRRAFTAALRAAKTGGFDIDLPFDANEAWGVKTVHHIAGTLSGVKVRGPLSLEDGNYRLKLGKAWRRDCRFEPGDEVSVMMWAEGPQANALPDDLAAALEASPAASAFWHGLATFYRKAYLAWVNGASRRPALRAQRVRELVRLLTDGKKQRER
jgi:hypothetical protein